VPARHRFIHAFEGSLSLVPSVCALLISLTIPIIIISVFDLQLLEAFLKESTEEIRIRTRALFTHHVEGVSKLFKSCALNL
jgi:hypothetical protein